MSENDKNVLLIVCDFHTKWDKRDTVFQKRRIQGFMSKIARVVGLMGEKFTFFPLGQPKFSGVSDFLFMLMLSFC